MSFKLTPVTPKFLLCSLDREGHVYIRAVRILIGYDLTKHKHAALSPRLQLKGTSHLSH